MLDRLRTQRCSSHHDLVTRRADVHPAAAPAGDSRRAEPYLAGLVLSGRRVVVIGAGCVAARRVPALLEAGAEVELIAPEAAESLRAAAADGDLAWRRREYAAGDLEHAWYALVATDDPSVNRAVSLEAERRRVFCVRADDRHAATAWTPATSRVDGVTVGVLSGGDPHRSRRVRDALADALSALGLAATAGRSAGRSRRSAA